MMEDQDRKKLQKNYQTLIEVRYSCVAPHLISNFILDPEMHSEIDCKMPERKKMEKLLEILPSRGEKAMSEFVIALKPSYSWLAKQLEKDDNNNDALNEKDIDETIIDMPISDHIMKVEKVLQKSTRVCNHWRFLARNMELKNCIVNDILREMSYSGGVEHAIHVILDSWVDKLGDRATFGKLIQHLEDEGMNRSADEIRILWNSVQCC